MQIELFPAEAQWLFNKLEEIAFPSIEGKRFAANVQERIEAAAQAEAEAAAAEATAAAEASNELSDTADATQASQSD
jgi:hypothetical protein